MVKPRRVEFLVVAGVEGPALYLNDFRVAGPKPWGGGKTLFSFQATTLDIQTALGKRTGRAVNRVRVKGRGER